MNWINAKWKAFIWVMKQLQGSALHQHAACQSPSAQMNDDVPECWMVSGISHRTRALFVHSSSSNSGAKKKTKVMKWRARAMISELSANDILDCVPIYSSPRSTQTRSNDNLEPELIQKLASWPFAGCRMESNSSSAPPPRHLMTSTLVEEPQHACREQYALRPSACWLWWFTAIESSHMPCLPYRHRYISTEMRYHRIVGSRVPSSLSRHAM